MAKGRETFTPRINQKLSQKFEESFPEQQLTQVISLEQEQLKSNSEPITRNSEQSRTFPHNYIQPGRSYKEELYASRRFDLNPSQNPNYAFRKLQTFLQDEKIPAKVKEKKHFVRPGLIKHAVIYAGRRKKFNQIVKDTISKIVNIHESQK